VSRRSCVLAALVLAPPLAAQGITARATVAPLMVGLNRQFVLNVEVSGTQQIDGDPTLPDMSDFATYLSSGTTTSMQIVNGRTTVSVIMQYRFQATKLGTFQIDAVRVRAGGKNVRTEPITLTVTNQPPPSTGAAPGGGDAVDIPPEDLFVTATPSKHTVFVNEPVVLEYRIYTRVNVDSYSIASNPSSPGFWTEELDRPQQLAVEHVTRNGRQYVSAVIDRVALFPTSSGQKTVEPLSIEAQVQVNARDPMDNLVPDFFSRGFGRRMPVVVASDSVVLTVQPLPDAGRPADFTGFVGSLGVSASLDKTDTQVNDAITYRLRITGEGNLRTLPDPSITFPRDFDAYPPKVSQNIDRSAGRVRGTKSYEYVLIPRSPGPHVIPAVRFDYYDLEHKRYASAGADSVVAMVTGTLASGPAIAASERGAVAPLRQDIRFIRVAAPDFTRRGRLLFDRAAFWLVLLVPVVTLAGTAGVRRHQDRLAGDVAFARGRRAARLARQRLATARSFQSPERAKEFHAEVGRALQGFLGDKLNVAEAGMIRESVAAALTGRGVAEEVVHECVACLDACDRYRYAPAEVTPEDMHVLLERAERAMANLDEALRA
jgi:BatD DUF11 like domain